MPFLPGSTEWQALQTANEAGSATGPLAAAVAAAAVRAAAGLAAAGLAVGVGLGASVGVGSGLGVSPGTGASSVTGAAVSAAAGAVSVAAGVVCSSLPPPQAARANRTVARAAAVFGANVIRNPQVWATNSGASYRRIARGERA